MSTFLAIDVGNTTVVVGLFDDDEIRESWRLSSFDGRTRDEIRLALGQFLAPSRTELGVGQVAMASVVPELTEPVARGCRELFGHDPIVVSHELELGIPIRYVDPSQVGPDRLANAVAVREEYRVPAIVVDLGTTTNFDVIAADGAFEGGVIAPGYLSSAQNLYRRAARLAHVELGTPKSAIGRTTEEAIRSGVVFGTASQIDGIVRRVAAELGGEPFVIATGGNARVVLEACETVDTYDAALTLKGIRAIARLNRGS